MSRRTEPIKVLVVDDSALMRKLVSHALNLDRDITVVGFARNGQEAYLKTRQLAPDVVTMDVEMPLLDGLSAVKRIMNDTPVPIVMVSALTAEGTEATIEALEAGAVDFVAKPSLGAGFEETAAALPLKVKTAAEASVQKTPTRRGSDAVGGSLSSEAGSFSILIIGTSTGGPSALQQLVPQLPASFPWPVIVVQHMPQGFTGPLAQRLNSKSMLTVKEAEEGDQVTPGKVLVAPAGKQLLFKLAGGGARVRLLETTKHKTLFRPSVDVTLMSAAETFGAGVLGVILTGMGSDGTAGAAVVKDKGGSMIAEDKSSCVVYGMPRSVVEAGLVDLVLPLDQISKEIIRIIP